MRSPLSVLVVTLLALSPAPGLGQEHDNATPSVSGFATGLGAGWKPVDPARLDSMRGGFQTTSGMTLSFGIERAVYVNGALLATTRVYVPDVARMSGEQAAELARVNEGLIVQLGPGNQFEPAGGLPGVVIQNSLDGQDLRTLTVVDVGVDTLGHFQSMNAQAALQDAQTHASGQP